MTDDEQPDLPAPVLDAETESPEPQDPARDAVGDVQDQYEPDDSARRAPPNTPAQIVAKARAITRGYGGLCLQFTRICANIAGLHGSAKQAWAAAQHTHTGYTDAPAGAFLFMSHPRSKYGHVAVYLGDGTMRTTNSETNRIHTDPVPKWVGWGYKVEGWSEDLNGVHVPGLKPVVRGGGGAGSGGGTGAAGTTASSATTSGGVALGRGSTGAAVGRLQRALNKVFPAYSRLTVDNSYGPLTAGVVAEFQRRAGLPVTGNVDAATHQSLTRHGVRF